MDDLDDLSPAARKNSVLIPNKTILNLSFGQATEGEEDDQAVDEDDVKWGFEYLYHKLYIAELSLWPNE